MDRVDLALGAGFAFLWVFGGALAIVIAVLPFMLAHVVLTAIFG